MTEAQHQAAVVELAEFCGWRVYHTYDSRRSHPGWPDLVLVRPPELIIAELKTDKGRVTRAQQDWLDDLAACEVETVVWRPRDFGAIHQRLKRSYG